MTESSYHEAFASKLLFFALMAARLYIQVLSPFIFAAINICQLCFILICQFHVSLMGLYFRTFFFFN